LKRTLRMEQITKRFPGVTACNHIDISFQTGEIHALLGENGAGKTTLMNILYGLHHADEGRILMDDEVLTIDSPQQAIECGIGMVHQHFMLVPKFSVLENIVLGTPLDREPFLNLELARKKIALIAQETGLHISLDEKVANLCVGDQQRVEIVKALYKGAQILIMDEPTSVLTPQETDELFRVLKRWTREGNTVVFITHKMREVIEICDRISVLRDGKMMGTLLTSEVNPDYVAEMMVGRCISLSMDRSEQAPGQCVLSLQHVSVENQQGCRALDDVSFDVKEGEIVGIAGVDGNGQFELIEAILGSCPIVQGEVFLGYEKISGLKTQLILKAGVSCIPFSRQKEGLAMEFSIQDNFILKEQWHMPYAKKGLLQKKAIKEKVAQVIHKYNIKAIGPETKVVNMSGGNQQKVVVAREMDRNHRLLLACHPTHGLDIGAIEFIHKSILEERSNQKAVLLISTELDELFSLCDRILVFYQGKVMGEVDKEHWEVRDIGLMMLGNRKEELERRGHDTNR